MMPYTYRLSKKKNPAPYCSVVQSAFYSLTEGCESVKSQSILFHIDYSPTQIQ